MLMAPTRFAAIYDDDEGYLASGEEIDLAIDILEALILVQPWPRRSTVKVTLP